MATVKMVSIIQGKTLCVCACERERVGVGGGGGGGREREQTSVGLCYVFLLLEMLSLRNVYICVVLDEFNLARHIYKMSNVGYRQRKM